MTFIKTTSGSDIAIDQIREVREGPSEGEVTIYLRSGGERWVKKDVWEGGLEQATTRLVPASPGTFRVYPIKFDEVKVQLMRTPIIAWRVSLDGGVEPICSSWQWAHDELIIEHPDGTIEAPGELHPSLDGWLGAYQPY